MQDDNQDTGEKFSGCPDCGYHKVKHIVYDEMGMVEMKDGKVDYCEHGSSEPFAAFHIIDSNDVERSGHLENEEEFNDYRNRLEELYNLELIKTIKYSRFEDGKIIRGTFYENEDPQPPKKVGDMNNFDEQTLPFFNGYPMGKGGEA